MSEKKPEIEVRELAEKFFEEAINQLDDPERKEEVELEKETYIGVWMLGYRAGESKHQPAAGWVKASNMDIRPMRMYFAEYKGKDGLRYIGTAYLELDNIAFYSHVLGKSTIKKESEEFDRLLLMPIPSESPAEQPVAPSSSSYQSLFDLMYNEHGLTLLESEMADIIHVVMKMEQPVREVEFAEWCKSNATCISYDTGKKHWLWIYKDECYTTAQLCEVFKKEGKI